MAGDRFYIWSFEQDSWLAPDGRFSADFHAAEKYPIEEAQRIVAEANNSFNRGYAEMPDMAIVPVVEANK